MNNRSNNEVPISRAILWILLSTLCISGTALMGWLYYLHARQLKLRDEQYNIVAIVQNNTQPDSLKTVYLAELLNLSLDRPLNLHEFDTDEAELKLLKDPLIKRATIKKIFPGTLYIDYMMRLPFFLVGDFTNTAIDEEGFLFPFQPFYTPKNIPRTFLGLNQNECQWGLCLTSHPSFQTATQLIHQFKKLEEQFHLKHIDVSQANAEYFGKRQIVIVCEECGKAIPQFFLRLSTAQIEQELLNFLALQLFLKKDKTKNFTIDLRLEHLAFVKRD